MSQNQAFPGKASRVRSAPAAQINQTMKAWDFESLWWRQIHHILLRLQVNTSKSANYICEHLICCVCSLVESKLQKGNYRFIQNLPLGFPNCSWRLPQTFAPKQTLLKIPNHFCSNGLGSIFRQPRFRFNGFQGPNNHLRKTNAVKKLHQCSTAFELNIFASPKTVTSRIPDNSFQYSWERKLTQPDRGWTQVLLQTNPLCFLCCGVGSRFHAFHAQAKCP